MSEDNTNVNDNTDVSGNTGNGGTNDNSKTEGNTGTGNGETHNNQERMLSQSEVNRLVAKARDEGRRSGKDSTLKDYEGKHVLTDDELDKLKKDAVDAAIKEQALKAVRKNIQTEYGLTDAQLERISGDDETSLKADAELLFGALKKKIAPQLNTGNNNQHDDDKTPNAELNDWLKESIKNPRKH